MSTSGIYRKVSGVVMLVIIEHVHVLQSLKDCCHFHTFGYDLGADSVISFSPQLLSEVTAPLKTIFYFPQLAQNVTGIYYSIGIYRSTGIYSSLS